MKRWEQRKQRERREQEKQRELKERKRLEGVIRHILNTVWNHDEASLRRGDTINPPMFEVPLIECPPIGFPLSHLLA